MKTLKKIVFFLTCIFGFSINAQNQPFKVSVKGEGDPILLFPGFTCTGEVWEDAVAELSKTHECHIFTFAGFGGVAPIEKPWLPKIKEGIEKYISENSIKAPTIIGHSLGGALALWLASEEKSAFKKLIIVDALASTGALMMPNFKSEHMVYDNPYNQQLLAMDATSFEKMAGQMVTGMCLNTEKQQQIKDWMVASDRETYVYGYTDLLKLDLREDISRIQIPVTILAATHPYGKEMAGKTYEEQYKNLKSYEIKFADEAAHFIMYDQPEWFIEQLTTELGK